MPEYINISKEELFQKFIVENLTRSAVAKYFKCSEATIKKKLAIFGIKKLPELYQINSKKTFLEKYGTESLTDLGKEKREQTNLIRYGVRKPFQSRKIQEKVSKSKEPSYLEKIVIKFLETNNLVFEREFSVDIKEVVFMPFDFKIILNDNKYFFIEVDGLYHTDKNPFGEKEKERKQLADERRNSYCLENNIPLLRLQENYEDYESIIRKFIDNLI